MKIKMKKAKLSLAIGLSVSLLSMAPALQAATVEELSEQMMQMQKHMQAMEAELQQLRKKDQPVSKDGNIVITTHDYGELKEEVLTLREDIDDLDDRLMAPEKHAVVDGIEWGGDFRFQVHSVNAQVPSHISGLGVGLDDWQNGIQPQMITMLEGMNVLQPGWGFADLKQAVQSFPPEQIEGLLGSLAPNAIVPSYSYDDDILRTTRLRLEMSAKVAEDVSFYGRLAMYKVWGDSTGTQVFNGQPTSINWDGTQSTYPNSDDSLHLDRGYFTWSNIADSDAFLSVGRRPSTNGVPLNFRNDEARGGTPMGSVFNYQFDGITVGYNLSDESTLRLCYGVGYESAWGNGTQLKPEGGLDDTIFYGLVWDAIDTPSMYVHLIAARAEDISDGFPGMTVMPINPVTGEPSPGPAPIRYEPNGTVGNIDLFGFVVARNDGPFDYFLSYGYMKSDPTDYTGPFGGMFTDPFGVTESQSGDMYYAGVRYSFDNAKTKIGLEYNKGSEYWFNFAQSEDDYLAPKTSTRGDVWEAYLTHRIRNRFLFKLSYMDYTYDYSGSGWLLGAPQDLSSMPMLGFPTYDGAKVWNLSLTAGF